MADIGWVQQNNRILQIQTQNPIDRDILESA